MAKLKEDFAGHFLEYTKENPPENGVITDEYMNKMLEYYKKLKEREKEE